MNDPERNIEILKFWIFELWIWEKDQNATNPRHESIFFFSAVVQLGLPSIFSDEILRNHNETTIWQFRKRWETIWYTFEKMLS